MGAGKDMWIAAYDEACRKFVDEEWGIEEFTLEMTQLGYDQTEISDHIAELTGER